MKRGLKWAMLSVGALVGLLLVAVGVLYVVSNSHFNRNYDVTVEVPAMPADAASLAEGKRIFLSRGCVNCHGDNLAGSLIVDDPLAGSFTGANLTTGEGGLGNQLSDADIVRAIRHGVKPDGSPMIFMPSIDYFAMGDTDLGALIAYIRSVPPVDKPTVAPEPGPLSRLLFLQDKMPFLVSAEYIDHSAKRAEIIPALTVEYGRYIANTCTGCHGFGFSGGPIPGMPPDMPPALNITPHPETGLGKWSEADFIKAVREGVKPDGDKLRFPMPWENFAKFTDTEVQALWMYLETVPVKEYGGR